MNVKDLLRDDDAVSPVIGVILMVAITVILAAVIGTFVLGLGDQVQSSAPNANFQFEYSSIQYDDPADADAAISLTQVEVTHNGGQDVDASNVALEVGGQPAYSLDDTDNDGVAEDTTEPFASGTLSTGSIDTAAFVDTNVGGGTSYPANNPTEDGNDLTGDAAPLSPGDTVRVIWTSPNGDSSNTIGESSVPS